MRALHIIMPLGGLGSRFFVAGFMTPKPLITIDGVPMFKKALSCFDSLDCKKKFTFIVRYDHIEKFAIDEKIKSFVPNANFAVLTSNSRGAVETCMKAVEFIEDDDAVVILDCDFEFSSSSYFSALKSDLNLEKPLVAGRLVSFDSNDQRYSYAKVDDGMSVLQTAEKNPISSHALAGSYYFSTKKTFIDAATALIHDFNNDSIKTKELYLSLLFNYIIKAGGDVKLHKLEKYNSFGTPEELDAYLKKSTVKINGHSGCIVSVEGDCVKKSTFDKAYISRLKKQIEKQQMFSGILKQSQTYFSTPDIISTEEDAAHFSAFMKFINGKSCISYFENCDGVSLYNFINETINFINFELQRSVMTEVGDKVLDKYLKTKENVLRHPMLYDDTEMISLFKFYDSVFNSSLKCMMPVGVSHGDMTLSNMIFCDKEVFMIDFLDSFIETPLMDLVKLRQDTKYNWSYLLVDGSVKPQPFEKSRLNFYRIDCEIFDYYSKQEFFKSGYLVLQALNFMRILQYAKKKYVVDYLKMILNDLRREF